MIEVYLIRHGQASFGSDNYDQLSELGQQQAARLGTYLAQQNIRFSTVVTGELVRHRQTWDAMAASYDQITINGSTPISHHAFNEINAERVMRKLLPHVALKQPELIDRLQQAPGDLNIFRSVFVSVINSWVAGEAHHPKLGNWQDFQQRVTGGLFELRDQWQPGDKVAIITSGGPITAIKHHIECSRPGEAPAELDWTLFNASITRIHLPTPYSETADIELLDYNQIEHFSAYPDMHTTL